MKHQLTLVFGLISLLSLSSVGYASSPWIPEKGEGSLGGSFTMEGFNKFYRGGRKIGVPNGPGNSPASGKSVFTYTVTTTYEHGIADDWAADLSFGYTFARHAGSYKQGIDDTRIGLRYRLLNEYRSDSDFMPTVTLRAGAIIQGSYKTGGINDPGEAASGFETSLLIGKAFLTTGSGIFGEVGYRVRGENVPDDYRIVLGIYQRLPKNFTVSTTYLREYSISGIDIGEQGFDDRFRVTKEIQDKVEGAISYQDKRGWFYSLGAAFTVDGRNTGRDRVLFVEFKVPV